MNRTVFLSFAFPQSEYVATYFRDEVLPTVIGVGFEYFLSRDIKGGTLGYAAIVEKSKKAVAGISFLTRENIYRPWINFEAGMMLGSQTPSRILSLLLIGFDARDFPDSPLLDLQYAKLENRTSVKKMLVDIYKSISPRDHRHTERIKLLVDENWDKWTEHLSKMPAEHASLEYEALGRKIDDFGILDTYSDSATYIKDYPIKSFVDSLNEGSELYMFGRNLMYSSPGFDEIYKQALRRGLSLNFVCHNPNTFSQFIQCVSELNPDESLTPISKFRSLLSWIDAKRPPGKLTLKYYTGDMLDSVFCVKKNQRVTHLSWDLSFGRTRETDKRVFLLNPNKMLGQDIIKRYLVKIFTFASTVASYDGRSASVKGL